MKKTLVLLSMLFCLNLQAQVVVSESSGTQELVIAQVLTNANDNRQGKFTTKLITEETAIQYHDGKETYKTVRQVEYVIKVKGNKITKKRKVLSTQTENFGAKNQAEQVFPDMTFILQSAVFNAENIQKKEHPKMQPFTLTRGSDGTTSLRMDKLALAKANGMNTHVKQMGADFQFVEMSEVLSYNSQENQLYLNALRQITSTITLLSQEKSGKEHLIEVREDIKIK